MNAALTGEKLPSAEKLNATEERYATFSPLASILIFPLRRIA